MAKKLVQGQRVLTRLQEVVRRQGETKWGPDYQPAIQAVRGEAPRHSHAYSMPSARLQRRIQVLSKAERSMCVLALYCDRLWEFHEQHMLPMFSAAHPLAAHPVWRSYPWPSTRGTVEIAGRLGLEKHHPSLTALVDGERKRVPYPWIGDFLLFLTDANGPYVIAWDCKAEPGRHGKPGPGPLRRRESKKAQAEADAREQTYRACMHELGIRIRQVSPLPDDEVVLCSLRRLFSLHTRTVNLPDSLIVDLTGAFKEALNDGCTPLSVIHRRVTAGEDQLQARTLLDQLIWTRQLRVDLFQPILPDQPLNPERRDVLSVYSHLFAR